MINHDDPIEDYDPFEEARARNEEQRDRSEEAYNEWLMNGGDI